MLAGDAPLLDPGSAVPTMTPPSLPASISDTAPKFTVQWNGRQLHAVPGEFVFQFGTTTAPAVPEGWSVQSLGSGSWLLDAAGGTETQIKSWAGAVGAVDLEPNYIMRPLGTPVDPQYPSQWHLPRIQAPSAWDETTGSASVVVAILDSGIDYNHPDFSTAGTVDQKNLWRNAGEIPNNGRDDDNNGWTDDVYGYDFGARDSNPMDDDPNWRDREDANIVELGTNGSINKYTGHGTAVAGVMGAVAGATNPQQLVAGVNWDIDMMALKITRPGFGYVLSAAVEAYKYIQVMRQADVNIVVANCSWGTYDDNVTVRNLEKEIEIAGGQNVLTVAAAGDSGANIDTVPFYPAAFKSDYVLSVAATNRDDTLWVGSPDHAWRDNRSNFGIQNVDVAAPGKEILTTMATAIGGGTGNWEGSSMAAGIVSGVAALMRSAATISPALTIKQVIINTVQRVAPLNGRILSGGIVDASAAVNEIMLPQVPVVDIVKLPGQERGVDEGHSGFTSATWQIRVRGPLSDPRPLYVQYRTIDSTQQGGSATPDGRVDSRTTTPANLKADYIPVKGTLTYLPGPRVTDWRTGVDVGRLKSIPVKVFGDRNVEDDETLTLRIDRVYYRSAAGVEQTVNGFIATRQDIFTIINDDAGAPGNTDPLARTPQITFVGNASSTGGTGFGVTASTVESREGDTATTMMRFPLQLSLPTTSRVTVRYRTRDVEARAGVDYVAKTGMVTFAPNVIQQYIDIPIIGNVEAQANRTFQVELFDPTNAELPGGGVGVTNSGSIATGSIIDDDAMINVAGAASGATLGRVTAGEAASFMVVQLTLSRPVQKQVTVQYATKDISAIGGQDYRISRGTITFAPGTTAATIRIPLLDDTVSEANESFLLELSAPTNAGLSLKTVRCTITDNDGGTAAAFAAFGANMTTGTASTSSKAKSASRATVI